MYIQYTHIFTICTVNVNILISRKLSNSRESGGRKGSKGERGEKDR